jgi:uncharacterized delta-60 repeat protein
MRSKYLAIGLALLLMGLSLGACRSGEIQWQKSYGGTDYDGAESIQETADGGYIAAGLTMSFGAGGNDLWVLKLDPSGAVQWQKSYGGADNDGAYSIQETADGGYIVAGATASFGAEYANFWVLKLSPNGAVQWQKSYGADDDFAYSIQETADGGYIVAGDTWSSGTGSHDCWVLRLDPHGDVQWQKSYGGADGDFTYSIQETADGGYIVAGHTWSSGTWDTNFWVLKLNTDGDVQWQKSYGGADDEFAWSIQETADGGYIAAGATASFGAGHYDCWVLKLNADGDVQWQKSYGGTEEDDGRSIRETADGGYIVAGATASFGAGTDLWVLRLSPNGDVLWQKSYGGADEDFAWSIEEAADGGYIVAGSTMSFGAGGNDLWVLKLDPDGNITGCPTIADSKAIIGDTNATGISTAASVMDTSVEPADTDVTPLDTDCSVETQCCYPEGD